MVGGENYKLFLTECSVAVSDNVSEGLGVGIDALDCFTVVLAVQAMDMAGVVNIAAVGESDIKSASPESGEGDAGDLSIDGRVAEGLTIANDYAVQTSVLLFHAGMDGGPDPCLVDI